MRNIKILIWIFIFFIAGVSCLTATDFFTKVPIYGGEVQDMAICASSPSVIYTCGCYGGLWVSKDGGETWEETAFYDTPTPGSGAGLVGGANFVAVHPTLPNVAVASQFGSFPNKLFRSEDYGQTWTEVGNSEIYSQNVNIMRIVASEKTPGTFYLIGNNFTTLNSVFYKSTDAGKTWTNSVNIVSGKAVWSLCVDKNDVLYAAVVDAAPAVDLKTDTLTSGWLYKSTNGGSNWTNIKIFDACPQYMAISSNTLTVATGGGAVGSIYISTTAGQSFVSKYASRGILAVSTDGAKVYNYSNNRVNVSLNTGSAWSDFTAISTGALCGIRPVSVTSILIDPVNPNNVFITDAYQDAFLKSTDTAVTWRISNKGLGGLIVYDGCKDPGGNIYILGRMAVFKSSDNGTTWSEVFNSSGVDFTNGIVASPTTSYVFVSGYGRLWRSVDAGASWAEVLSVSGCEAVGKIVFNKDNPSIGYIGFRKSNPTGSTQGKYVYKTTNYGATWGNLDLTGHSVQSLAIDPQNPAVL